MAHVEFFPAQEGDPNARRVSESLVPTEQSALTAKIMAVLVEASTKALQLPPGAQVNNDYTIIDE